MAHRFVCKDAGALPCGAKITASSEEEMADKILEHVKKKHGVENPNQTLVDHLLTTVTRDEA